MRLSAIALLCWAGFAAAAPSGEDVYRARCASCHDQAAPRIPPKDALQKLPASRILKTLDFGLMMSIAYPLKREERVAVANYLGTTAVEQNKLTNACSDKNPITGSPTGNWNGWSASGDNTRYQTAEAGGISFDQVRGLKLKWAFGFPGDIIAFGAPTVFNGTVFTGSASGIIYALDARTGCTHWQFEANGPVRMAPLAVSDGRQTVLIFGDQIGWVYSLNAATGKQVWRKRVEAHEATRLTASLVAKDGVVYVPAASWEETRSLDSQYPCCTFRGSLTALRIRDGGQVWKTFMVDAPKRTGTTRAGTPTLGPSGAGIWSAPTIDSARGVIYVTTGDNFSHPATPTSDAIIALNLKTGRIQWISQTLPNDVYNSACSTPNAPNCPENAGPDYDFGASALLLKTADGRDMLAAGQKSGVVFALDPDQKGKVLWQTRVGQGGINGGVQWGMASDGQRIYASTGDSVRQPSTVPRTASLIGNADYDPSAGGGVTALRIGDGSKAWFAEPQPCVPARPGCSPAQSGALTALPGLVLSGSLDGHIRAYNAEDGRVIWDLDTAREYTTVNGVAARGGSLDGAGPVIGNGMVFLNSGYPRNGGMPGNVLLAFGPE